LLFVLANVVGFVGWGISGAIFIDAQLSAAAALGIGEKSSFKGIHEELTRNPQLKSLGPRRCVLIVRLLAERARSPDDVAAIGPPIGLLWIIGEKPEMSWLVERFDTLLRLYEKQPSEAMEACDTLVAATQRSAATMAEMLEAMVVAGGGSETAGALPSAGITA
jgi:hypothetical protein